MKTFFKWALVGVAVIAVIIGAIYQLTPKEEGVEPVQSSETSSPTPEAPAPSATPTDSPDGYEFVEQPIAEDMVDELDISDDPRPSDELVWQFEEAYWIGDPEKRTAELAPFVTPQYLDANRTDEDRSGGATLSVVRKSSTVEIAVSEDRTAASVVTTALIHITRNGELVNELPNQVHATFWINTPEGWKVAQETAVE